MRWVVVSIVVLSVFYMLVAAVGPRAVGLWQDDAIYLVTAKSLAEGRGYRHVEIPGQPYQTKYPIGYPAMLAAGFAIWRGFPANLPLLLTPGAVAAAAFVVLSAVYLRRVFQEPVAWAVTVGVLAALSPEIVLTRPPFFTQLVKASGMVYPATAV